MGSIAGSLHAIGPLRRFVAETVVAGHGPIGGPELFDQTESYLRWLQEVAEEGVRAGLSPVQAAREADLAEFASLLDSERLVGNLHRAYAERADRPLGAPIDVMAGFREMVEFHGGLPRCHA